MIVNIEKLEIWQNKIDKAKKELGKEYKKNGYRGFYICERKNKKKISYIARKLIKGKNYQIVISSVFEIEKKIDSVIKEHCLSMPEKPEKQLEIDISI